MFTIRTFASFAACVAVLSAVLAVAVPSQAAEDEAKLIAVLDSSAPPAEKAITCKKLTIYGSKAAVPSLAKLLVDPDLTSWARIALEAIPGGEADAALRDAMGKLKGRMLIGVINSIAVRRDAQAVEPLIARLKDADAGVAASAAAALGKIGCEKCAQALEQALKADPVEVRQAAGEGCVICAENLAAAGKVDQAVRLLDVVRKANVPKQIVLDATRGAILVRKAEGVPLLAEQLQSPDKALFGIGLRTARELAVPGVAEALLAQVEATTPLRQAAILATLSDRGDTCAVPAAQKLVESPFPTVRTAALAALGVLGNEAQVPVLLKAVVAGGDQAPGAREALKRLKGGSVNAALINCAKGGDAAQRAEAILALSARQAAEGVGVFLDAMEAPENNVRQNAVVALRQLAGMEQYGDLLARMLDARNDEARRAIQSVLVAVSRRSDQPAQCAKQLMDAWKKAPAGPARMSVLEVICWLGLPDTLPAVQEGLKAPDADTRKAVVQALSNWPDSRIVPTLMDIARSDSDATIKVLAFRVAAPRVSRDESLQPADKAARFAMMMKLADRLDEKKLVLAELKSAPCKASLDLAAGLLDDKQVASEAALAICEMASQRGNKIPANQLKPVLEKAAKADINPQIRQRIEAQLKKR